MGSSTGYICRTCGTHFRARSGGGFFFDLLRCDACGRTRSVGHGDLGDTHLRYVKGLPGPYALARTESDRRREEHPGEPMSRDEYRAAAEATVAACACGGRFRYDAPARCPSCRSTSERWDRILEHNHHDCIGMRRVCLRVSSRQGAIEVLGEQLGVLATPSRLSRDSVAWAEPPARWDGRVWPHGTVTTTLPRLCPPST